jgi:hypothetical protein
MDQVLAHLQEYYVAYGLVALGLLPIIYATRRYSVPLIFYTIEIIIYLIAIHVAVWAVVVTARWFKEQSTMRVLSDGSPVAAPDWSTPLLEFWQRDLYSPSWLVWLEVVLALIVVGLVFKYRPMRVQQKRGWRFSEKKAKKTGANPASRLPIAGRPAGRGGRR